MKLFFLRHGQADWPEWTGDDDERPLTEKGQKEVRRAARFWAQIGVAPQTILTSPLPRAAQTAQIAVKAVGGEIVIENALSPGATPRTLRALLKNCEGDVMIVGHEPDLSAAIRAFTGGDVKMAKASLARVDIEAPGKGRLIWLLPPKISAR